MTVLKNLPNGISVFSLNGNETDYLYREIFHDESYIPPGGVELAGEPVILDVGANIGLFTLFAAQKWPGARIFSFEPMPDIFDVLRKNTGHLPGVTLHNTALGAEKQFLPMTYYPNYTMIRRRPGRRPGADCILPRPRGGGRRTRPPGRIPG